LQPVYLFDLASRHAEWATVRQAVISGNIANANTPGFRAREVEPFQAVMDETRLVLAKTSAGHLDTTAAELGASKDDKIGSWDITYSGNSVSLDQELVKADDVNRAFSLNASIVKAFHRMLLTSVRTP
jgi:flagellar basal-body rod protein FlgB